MRRLPALILLVALGVLLSGCIPQPPQQSVFTHTIIVTGNSEREDVQAATISTDGNVPGLERRFVVDLPWSYSFESKTSYQFWAENQDD